ncbi:HD domain-containing protein [Brevinema andersonii]|uniref:HD domain-containing protein n=1 Tax=Brevinema andersonii TaxID=34097 RepID=A0A1I1EW65_BREAD|nr:HD domain-containing phosphohydrolase [Brevinema andersonii]SFB91385.1 HD domain-containing protein [Brevinema andersonii]
MSQAKKYNLSQLQSGMMFTDALYNKKMTVLLPGFYPILPEFLIEWAEEKQDTFITYGMLIRNDSLFRTTLPGYIDISVRQYIALYNQSLAILKAQFQDLKHIDIGEFQKIATQWTESLLKEKDAHLLLRVIRYANPLEEDYFYAHMLDVSLLSLAILYQREHSSMKLIQIALSGLLYDIGMTRLPEYMLNSQDSFDAVQKQEIEKHTVLGFQMITRELRLPTMFAMPALEHHERFDGSGYPRKLRGPSMSMNSAIIGLADIFTSQIRNRTFKPAREPAEILKDFVATTMNHFNPEFVRLFLSFINIYPASSFVTLNTGEIVTVVRTYILYPQRPTVMLVCDKDGKRDLSRKEIPLHLPENEHLHIVGMFSRKHLFSLSHLHVIPVYDELMPRGQNPNYVPLDPLADADGNKEINIQL